MTDWRLHSTDSERWITGFEGDRRVVLARIGPFQRVFARPAHYVKRIHHRVYTLLIEDWEIPLDPLSLGTLCKVRASLNIRFQPTLACAREHIEQIDRLGDHIREQYRCLIKDAAEAELRALESINWLDDGHARLERSIEDLVHELLAIRDIQSRCRCRIEAAFADVDMDRVDEDIASADPLRNAIALQILRRRRDTLERVARERHEQQLLEQRLELEHQQHQRETLESLARSQREQELLEQRLQLEQEQRRRDTEERLARIEYQQSLLEQQLKLDHQRAMLDLLRQETELLRAQQQEKVEQVREALHVDEISEAERIRTERRLKEERLQHELELQRLEQDSRLAEHNEQAASFNQIHDHLQREIELLALERQRLTMEEEVHKTKLARAKGWFVGAKSRFPLGKDKENAVPMDALSRDLDEPS